MSTPTKSSYLNTASKDKFLLVITPPPVLLETANDLGLKEVQMNIFGSPVPEINIPAKTIRYEGQSLKVTSQAREPYTSLNVGFTIDSGFKNYWFLYNWLNLMNIDTESGMDPHFNNYKEYDQNITFNNKEAQKDIPSEISTTNIINTRNGESIFNDYKTNLTVYGLDEYNNKIIEFKYHQAFLTSLGQIEYNYRDGNVIDSSATFEYSQFTADLLNDC